MGSVHLHLILNHLPAAGVLIAAAIFALGRLRGTPHYERLALGLLVVFGLVTIPVYLTGGAAEQTIRGLPGVSRGLLEAHEDAAGAAFTASALVAGLSLLGLAWFRRAAAVPRAFAVTLLLLAGVTTGVFAWTGYLGGQIRHPEIRASGPLATRLAALGGAREEGR